MASRKSMAVVEQEPDQPEGVDGVEGDDAAVDPEAGPEFGEWDKERNLAYRLLAARADARRMLKRGKVEHKGQELYSFVQGDDITQEGNRLFALHGICPFPTIAERHQDGNKTTLKIELELINVDNPDDTKTTIGWGSGIDSQDKGEGKAYSYALKYATAKSLGLNTSDDIEEHQENHVPITEAAGVQKAQETAEQTIITWAKNFKTAVENCNSYEGIKKLKSDNKDMLKSNFVPESTRDYLMEELNEREEFLKKELLKQDNEESKETAETAETAEAAE